MKNTLTQTPIADVYAELEERFDAWCELRGIDRNTLGAWEQFDREND